MNRLTMAGSPSSLLVNRIAQGFMNWQKLLGSEKVTNGTFTGNATGWTLNTGWTYNANAVDRDGAGTATMEQDVSAVVGEVYRVEYTLSAYTDGSVTVTLGGTAGTARSSAATFVEYIKAATTGNLLFTPAADATFTLDTVSVKKVGVVSADGVSLFIEDRGATAGKGALHIITEDSTAHVFGDRVGIGTLYPSVFFEVNGLSQFASNIQFGASALGIAAASIDASTILLIARNAAAQTQTVLTVVGAATVANSYITAQVGGTWTLASGATWTIPAHTLSGTIECGGYGLANLSNITLEAVTAARLLTLGAVDNSNWSLICKNTAAQTQVMLKVISKNTIGASEMGFFGATPVAQQTGIADADGTLADITTKFNSLLGKCEAYGLLTTV